MSIFEKNCTSGNGQQICHGQGRLDTSKPARWGEPLFLSYSAWFSEHGRYPGSGRTIAVARKN